METIMSESDWVVLRMLHIILGQPITSRQHKEAHRAVQYLYRKYGGVAINRCIDLLKAEEME